MTQKYRIILFATVIIFLSIYAYNFLYPRIAGQIVVSFYPSITDYLSGQVKEGIISNQNAAKLTEFLMLNKAIQLSLSVVLSLLGAAAITFYLKKKKCI